LCWVLFNLGRQVVSVIQVVDVRVGSRLGGRLLASLRLASVTQVGHVGEDILVSAVTIFF